MVTNATWQPWCGSCFWGFQIHKAEDDWTRKGLDSWRMVWEETTNRPTDQGLKRPNRLSLAQPSKQGTT